MITGTWCARRAVAIALARMVEEGQLTEAKAVAWARAVLHPTPCAFTKKPYRRWILCRRRVIGHQPKKGLTGNPPSK